MLLALELALTQGDAASGAIVVGVVIVGIKSRKVSYYKTSWFDMCVSGIILVGFILARSHRAHNLGDESIVDNLSLEIIMHRLRGGIHRSTRWLNLLFLFRLG
jgi:hypothetical protein